MSRGRYFKEQRSGNGAIYHCVKTEIEPGDGIRLFNFKINSVLNQLREGTAFCVTSATESSIYHNDSFFVFV